MPDGLLTETRLREALGTRRFRFEPQVGSTNDLARQWAQDGKYNAPAGAVVIAEEQTQGRGRLGRSWTAPAGTALLMSVILRPVLELGRISSLTMVGAVAVADVLTELVPGPVGLKWPNDVQIAGQKVAGILPEAVWRGDLLEAVVLGIGLNVRVDFTGTVLADRAISLETATGTSQDRAVLLGSLLQRIDYWTERITEPMLFQAWRDRLTTLGQRVTAHAAGGEVSGEAVDIDADGALLLRSDDGLIHRVVAGEVTLSSDR